MVQERKYHKFIAIVWSIIGRVDIKHVMSAGCVWFICTISPVSAQDVRFSQWFATHTTVNPAFAGAFGDPRLMINFRDQWPTMPQSYVTYRAAGDAYVGKIRSGLGFNIMQDVQGDGLLTSTQAGLQYMYQARIGANYALNIGIGLDYLQYSINWQDIQFYDQISLLTGFNDAAGNPNPSAEPVPASDNFNTMDVSMGLLFYSNRLYVGMAFDHLNTPTISFYGNSASTLPGAIGAQAGVFFGGKKKDDLLVNPYLLWSSQAGFNQLQTGVYAKKGLFLGGLAFKHNTANLSDVVLLVGLAKGMVRFGYSYDISTGQLAGLTGGAHEVSLMFTFKERTGHAIKNGQKSMLECPRVL